MNQNDLKALETCLDEDEKQPMMAASAGVSRPETLKTATARAIAGGVSLKAIFAAIITGYMSGGLSGAIAAVLALIVTP